MSKKNKLYALDPLLHPTDDLLHQESQFVDKLYYLITENIEPPYAISIDGLWGSGKTSIMKLLEKCFDDQENQKSRCPTFWFNPWEYQKSKNIVLAFLQNLAREFSKDEKIKVDAGKILKTIMYFGVDIGLKAVTKGTFGFEDIGLSDIEGKLAELDGKDPKTLYSQYEDTIGGIKCEFRNLIDSISKGYNNNPVIIFFDDLDRCLPDEAIQLLEAVKNMFVIRNCKVIFVCGIDTRVAKRFIIEHYKGIEEDFAINYFRKIFNLTISVPQSTKIYDLLLDHIKNLYGWNHEKSAILAKMIYTRGLQVKIPSIRKYLNIANNFYAFLEFNPAYEYTPLNYDPPNDLCLNLLVIKEVWQNLFEFFVTESLRSRNQLFHLIRYKSEDMTKEQRAFIKTFIEGRGSSPLFEKVYLHELFIEYPSLA